MTTTARTDESPASKLAPALCALLIVSIFVTSGVGYVWYKSVNAMLASEIIKLEPRLKDLVDLNRSREHQLAALSSPVELDARVKKLNLGLGQPDVSQIVRLPEPAPAVRASGATARPAALGAEAE